MLGQVREQSRLRMRRTQAVSQVRPGPRQMVLHWVSSGRLFSLLLFLASLGVLIYLFISPQFNVSHIHVEGNTVLKHDTVAHLSGLDGLPIWFVDSDMAAEHVLQNAYVENVRVNIALPDQAAITISERRPEIRWAVGGIQYLIDGSGRVLDVATEPPEPDTLVIMDTSSQSALEPMDHVDLDAMHVAQALALRLPNELNFTPQMIGWDIALGVYVKSSSGQTIVFGQSDQLDRKLAFLRHLLEDGTAFTYLDLRPSNPFYRTEG
jgi:cell division protein FtsQ